MAIKSQVSITVNLSESEIDATIGNGAAVFRRYGQIVAGMELEDAVKFAEAVLQFAAGTAIVDEGEQEYLDMIAKFEDVEDARYDAISAHWGHD